LLLLLLLLDEGLGVEAIASLVKSLPASASVSIIDAVGTEVPSTVVGNIPAVSTASSSLEEGNLVVSRCRAPGGRYAME
jgi:hypothetical protein